MTFGALFLSLDRQGWLTLGLGSLASLLVALLIYFWQKSPKTLDYGAYEPQPLGADDDVFPGLKLAVTWAPPEEAASNGEPESLTEAQLSHYRIKNTGKQAIRASDFQTPITVTAPEGRLIDCNVIKVSHPGVCDLGSVYLSCDGDRPDNQLSFRPALMNPGDWVEVLVLTDGLDGDINLTAWIVEETRSMRQKNRILLPPLRELTRLVLPDFLPIRVAVLLLFAVVNFAALAILAFITK